MLGKLIKHEFIRTGRYIVMIMVALVVVTPVTALYLRFGRGFFESLADANRGFEVFDNIVAFLCTTLYTVAVIGVLFVTFICLLYSFYRSMVSSESYLTHTLPVKTSSILISKGIVALVWTILSFILMFLSVVVFTKIVVGWSNEDAARGIRETLRELDIIGFDFGNCVVLIIAMIIGTISNITMYGACFAIGHRVSGHPVLGAVVSYIGITIVLQTITSIVIGIISGIGMFDFMHISTSAAFNIFMGFIILYSTVTSVLFYMITLHMFKNKLNI